MRFEPVRKAAIAAMIVLGSMAVSTPAMADEVQPIATTMFKKMTTMMGEWTTQDHPALRIVFEPTAGGSVIVERWMVGERMHSLTVYHLDGEALMATHYCPQGNQPRLRMESVSTETRISFDFQDATNLQNLEQSHQHRLSFDFSEMEYVTRGEAYRQGVSSNQTEMVLVRIK
ncbi:MAG: hypothetical protein ACK5RU_14135 [Hyphomonadaceae bacterium]